MRKISLRQTCPRHLTGLLDGFRRLYCAGKLPVELEIFFSLRSHPEGKHSGFHLSLVLSSPSPEEKRKIEPRRSLQLCGIFGVRRTLLTTLKELLDLLFRNGFLVNYAAYPARLSEVLHKGIQDFVCLRESSVGND